MLNINVFTLKVYVMSLENIRMAINILSVPFLSKFNLLVEREGLKIWITCYTFVNLEFDFQYHGGSPSFTRTRS